jgi:hypothetical protein
LTILDLGEKGEGGSQGGQARDFFNREWTRRNANEDGLLKMIPDSENSDSNGKKPKHSRPTERLS